MNWDAIHVFMRAARRSAGREPAAGPDALRVDMDRVMTYRANVQCLTERLEYGEHVAVAHAGLQDSAPRAALLALHARMRDVGPNDWEHPSLAQVWFRLGADWVIPRADADVFTVGSMPDDPGQHRALNELGEMVRAVVARAPMRTRDVVAALGDRLPSPLLVRVAQISGKILIRWDARTTEIIARDDPTTGVAAARTELSRRFVHWYGPAGPVHFAKWAAVPKAEAHAVFDALDLVEVDVGGRARWILRDDEPALRAARPAAGVRLLPHLGDPYTYLDQEPPPRALTEGPDVPRRLVNSITGRILLDGELVGAWGRAQQNVTLFPWRTLSKSDIERIDDEARSFSGPLGGKDVRIRWLDR